MDIDPKDIKIIFEPGCFDSFEGTQEELDAMIEEIKQKVADGTFFEDSVPLEESPEMVAALQELMNELDEEIFPEDLMLNPGSDRKLQ